jgi:hypothetical protein
MIDAKLQAWWSYRQGLDGRLIGKPASDILAQTGWARSVGGAGSYLTLFARGRIGRKGADDAVAQLEMQELPGARGCTYVVPACDYALALKAGQDFFGEEKTALKLGVMAAEIKKLCAAVLKALDREPLDPDELRKACSQAVRNLGNEGKSKGLTTTLPVALGRLQAAGQIRRVPINGRLDQQRYRYALWRQGPLAHCLLAAEQAYAALARKFFSWIGPATLAEFQWFSGLGAKAAQTAVAPLKLEPLETGSERLMLPEERADFSSFKIPEQPRYVLVSSLDGITHLRRDVERLLAPEDVKRGAFCGKGLMDLIDHAILDRGRLVGLWEYNPAEKAIVWMSFVSRNPLLEKAVAETEEFVRDELGDARSFSLDSLQSRAPRIEALRQATRHGR